MRADLPTEEDVLAFLVLNFALGELTFFSQSDPAYRAIRDAIDSWRCSSEWSGALEAAAHERLLTHGRIHIDAIADSERRLDCERARDAVVEAADEYSISPDVDHTRILHAAAVLRVARRALLRAEVSRHGG